MSSCNCTNAPKAGELGDLAVNQIADLVFLIDILPRIIAQLFDAEADSLVVLSMSMTSASTSSFFLKTSLG